MTTAVPFLMFQRGLAKSALDFYFSIFPEASLLHADYYQAGEPGPEGSIKMARFTLCGREFLCSDSPIEHGFDFTPSISIFVDCSSIEEMESIFHALADKGEVLMPMDNYGFSTKFGWVNDQYKVSWQLNLPA